MHKSATKCNETQGKWCKNKHGASKIIDTLETYQTSLHLLPHRPLLSESHTGHHLGGLLLLRILGRRGWDMLICWVWSWYVSNISIIFDAPCLFIHHLLCVLFTLRGIFMHFLELTYQRDATVPVPCFLLFLYFRKVTQEIFSELYETKAEVHNYLTRRRSPKESRR
jgi:hypothetical protein